MADAGGPVRDGDVVEVGPAGPRVVGPEVAGGEPILAAVVEVGPVAATPGGSSEAGRGAAAGGGAGGGGAGGAGAGAGGGGAGGVGAGGGGADGGVAGGTGAGGGGLGGAGAGGGTPGGAAGGGGGAAGGFVAGGAEPPPADASGSAPGVAAGGATTLSVKGPTLTVDLPSDTRTMISTLVPASARLGVPDSTPLTLLMPSQAGRFCAVNVSASPSGSWALNWKLNGAPAVICDGGAPLTCGALFGFGAFAVAVLADVSTAAVESGAAPPPPPPRQPDSGRTVARASTNREALEGRERHCAMLRSSIGMPCRSENRTRACRAPLEPRGRPRTDQMTTSGSEPEGSAGLAGNPAISFGAGRAVEDRRLCVPASRRVCPYVRR
jgi:hypothetical protein